MIMIYRDFYVNAFCMLNKILVIDVLLHSTSMLKLELWMTFELHFELILELT